MGKVALVVRFPGYAAWQRHPWRERQLFLEAFCWLGLMRLLVLSLPFRWLLSGLRLHPCPVQMASVSMPCDPHPAVLLMRHAVQSASVYTPWTSNCLAQALAAHRMLHRQRLPSTLYIGVAKPTDQPFTAHAWLRCGEAFVTGETGWQHFTPLACFEGARNSSIIF